MARLTHSLERATVLDGPAKAYAKWVRSTIPRGPLKDAISGTWLGHALHPVLTDVPIGAWTSATVLDLIGGRDARSGADRLVAIGVVAAVPTAVTGVSEWADSELNNAPVRRIGAIHALANVAALGLYGASLAARLRGDRARGVALGLAGAGTLVFSGRLGGHLSFARGIGVDQAAFEPPIEDWTDLAAGADVREDRPVGAQAGTRAVVLVRRGGRVHALDSRCVHRGGPLPEGELVDGCIECPWHGSRFRLDDGSVERGPAAYPQPVFEVRERDGRVEVRFPAEP
jgi:nitrite reductase/ring-hydroxylating ferredoxin subunit/uncharacterized membrane protein